MFLYEFVYLCVEDRDLRVCVVVLSDVVSEGDEVSDVLGE